MLFGDDTHIHRGAFASLMKALDHRERPLVDTASVLPSPDVDLGRLMTKKVRKAPPVPEDLHADHAQRKWLTLQKDFRGQPRILLLHAMLIAISRRRDPDPVALDLFFRIWREQGKEIAAHLPVRWMISASTTFADHGQTGDQRALGMGLSLLFDLIKLHDSERSGAGLAGDIPTPLVRHRDRTKLAFDMAPYSFPNGDLDRNMLARLWRLAEREDTMGPLATQMLWLVMRDRRSVFARVEAMKPARTGQP